jgi:fructose-1,6-bisphosphatase/inositol monophosphatase family enzyme
MSSTVRRPAPNGNYPTAHEAFALRRVLARSVSAVGERMLKIEKTPGEFDSLDQSHVSSSNDLEALALIVRYVPEFLAREGLPFLVSFENEEVPMIPPTTERGKRVLRLIIDPVDGTKAMDNYLYPNDVALPRPSSAISIAAVCPVTHELIATAVHCFDVDEVYSSCLINSGSADPEYIAFRGDSLLSHLSSTPSITAKRRVLNGKYNSKALVGLAEMELRLMDGGLNPTFGGLTGSSATDIVNVARGSFAACMDVRALCGAKGSVPYWYDIAAAIGIARGRGLRVLVMNNGGAPLEGADYPIYTPVSFLVARPDVFEIVLSIIREKFTVDVTAAAAA